MIAQAFEALKTYNWGTDIAPLAPIENAVVATRDDPAAGKELERQLIAALQADLSRDAKDYICRKLRVVGTAESVPALTELLDQDEHSHMARYALERIPVPQATKAMRDALPRLNNKLKVGVIGSLGVRQDAASVPAIAELLNDADEAVARSAALALGSIQTPQAAAALRTSSARSPGVKTAVTDAVISCAEAYVAAGNKSQALALYKSLTTGNQPKHVRLAATRGMLACAGRSD